MHTDVWSRTHSEPEDTGWHGGWSGCDAKAKRLMLNITSPLSGRLQSMSVFTSAAVHIMWHPKLNPVQHLLARHGSLRVAWFKVSGLPDSVVLLLLLYKCIFFFFFFLNIQMFCSAQSSRCIVLCMSPRTKTFKSEAEFSVVFSSSAAQECSCRGLANPGWRTLLFVQPPGQQPPASQPPPPSSH